MSTHTFFIEPLSSPTGTLLLLTDDRHRVRALDWEDHSSRMHRLLRTQYGAEPMLARRESRSDAARRLDDYFAGDLTAIDALDVETAGTAFQREVWAALRRISAGDTVSYSELAASIDRPKAVRAVGLANGSNPIGIIVPCHRVIGANGSLTGYGGGIERKRWLLEHEQSSPVRRSRF